MQYLHNYLNGMYVNVGVWVCVWVGVSVRVCAWVCDFGNVHWAQQGFFLTSCGKVPEGLPLSFMPLAGTHINNLFEKRFFTDRLGETLAPPWATLTHNRSTVFTHDSYHTSNYVVSVVLFFIQISNVNVFFPVVQENSSSNSLGPVTPSVSLIGLEQLLLWGWGWGLRLWLGLGWGLVWWKSLKTSDWV